MKSYIENELKRNKIPKKYKTTKESNRGSIYWQATAVPVSQLAIPWHGCKAVSTHISCTMLAYIYSAHAPCVIAMPNCVDIVNLPADVAVFVYFWISEKEVGDFHSAKLNL